MLQYQSSGNSAAAFLPSTHARLGSLAPPTARLPVPPTNRRSSLASHHRERRRPGSCSGRASAPSALEEGGWRHHGGLARPETRLRLSSHASLYLLCVSRHQGSRPRPRFLLRHGRFIFLANELNKKFTSVSREVRNKDVLAR